ncbi:Twin arginine translocation signal domain containing protein [Halorhabdus tiamatea SARL4B]|uniref:Gluconate 2-dehydrogenase subunit 3 n=1 Tax=Halorhabdus tiamatea SARL4B TaxID=1033806 RepID=F7PFC1_9EURY|nr:gluconate 2-dehydrogenase subunit 3 family protein [Halorhabdus tiamatea]ERJ05751.1 Twin arginine translocation signal domain containing protein [Halorhabdus tiamatea SARL4B]CCQ33925.1 gluconate 2-dehydrogenase subunit 3 [Halorhabdus tiamatea SARL4B]
MTHELTRRDAIAALSAVGASLAGCVAPVADGDEQADEEADSTLSDHDHETLTAAAEVLYPDDVTEIETFVQRYATGRTADRPEHADGIADAVAYLDKYCRAWYDAKFTALSPDERDEALRRMGADDADPDPDGSDVERLRYYVINDLLLALYASPTGGELVGIENPPGHPGGLASYQRGPQS